MGSPHVYAFQGFLDGLTRNHGSEIGSKNLKVLQEWQTKLTDMSWQEVAEVVKVFKLSKVYDKEQRRITLCLTPDCQEERKAVVGSLGQLGWTRKHGKAPPSHMERELQGFLDELLK